MIWFALVVAVLIYLLVIAPRLATLLARLPAPGLGLYVWFQVRFTYFIYRLEEWSRD